MFDWAENRLLGKDLKKLSSFLFPAYKLIQKNIQVENMCDIVFEKTKDGGGTVNRTSVYGEAAV